MNGIALGLFAHLKVINNKKVLQNQTYFGLSPKKTNSFEWQKFKTVKNMQCFSNTV